MARVVAIYDGDQGCDGDDEGSDDGDDEGGGEGSDGEGDEGDEGGDNEAGGDALFIFLLSIELDRERFSFIFPLFDIN